MSQDELRGRYGAVLRAIQDACRRSGRAPESVTLLAVSKFHDVRDMLTLHALGQPCFGENYVQEAMEKMAVFDAQGIPVRPAFHLIGHVQSRKAAQVAGRFALIHSLDSRKLALGMERELARQGGTQDVLIEVNIGSEPQKSGIFPADLAEFADSIIETCPHLLLQGLMCLPPVWDAGEEARPYFARLRELKDSLSSRTGRLLPVLSMGMSGDFATAIEEGATIVRIGTAIFGERPQRKPLDA